MKTVLLYLKVILSQLAQLSNPVADVALVGLIVKLLPFIHVNTANLVEILAAVGLIAAYLQHQLTGVGDKITQAKVAQAKAEQK